MASCETHYSFPGNIFPGNLLLANVSPSVHVHAFLPSTLGACDGCSGFQSIRNMFCVSETGEQILLHILVVPLDRKTASDKLVDVTVKPRKYRI